MGNYGVKIAKSGYNYTDGDKNLILNTAYSFLKIKGSGTGSIILSSGVGNKTVYTHNLGYKPMFYVWMEYIDYDGSHIQKKRMTSWRDYLGLGVWNKFYTTATTTVISMSIYSGFTGNETLDYVYVVYYDPIQ